jgi:hypothetical protein
MLAKAEERSDKYIGGTSSSRFFAFYLASSYLALPSETYNALQ